MFDADLAPTLVVTSSQAAPGAVDAWRAAGAKVETVAPAPGGSGVDLDRVFELLGREGVLQVLVEGGGTLLGSVLAGGYAQRLVVYVAPLALGVARHARVRVRGTRHDRRRRPLHAHVGPAARPGRAPRLRGRGLMFTGIVEELGRVRSVTPNEGGARLVIEAEGVLDDAEIGASIAVNGCCLTVVTLDDDAWAADAVIETLARRISAISRRATR